MNAPGARAGPAVFRRLRLLFGLLFLLTGAISLPFADAQAQDGTGEVIVVRIDGTIDLGLAPFLERVLNEAEESNAEAVILDIDTPGGRLDAVLQMQDSLLDANIRTIAFVNRQAFSAGALIAIASNEIYMVPGASMGAATPVTGEGETADEKTISAVRSTFRSTADQRGRDSAIAEAMVDPTIAIEGLVTDQQLLTLSTNQALEYGYAEGSVANLDELLEAAGLEGATVQDASITWSERLVRILTEPVIASLLFSMGSLFILIDIFSGDLGVFSLIGVGLIATFFWGHFLAGLAGWEGVLLVIVGLALLGVEVFLLPGLGIAGVLGLASLLGGLFLSLVGQEIITDTDLQRAGTGVAIALIAILVGGALMLRLLPSIGGSRGLILQTRLGETEVVAPRRQRGWLRAVQSQKDEETTPEPIPPATAPQRSTARPSLVGARGPALSDLHPGGFARIEGERVDVVTRGDYIRAGEEVEVIQDEGYRRVVRRVEPDEQGAGPSAGGESARLRRLG